MQQSFWPEEKDDEIYNKKKIVVFNTLPAFYRWDRLDVFKKKTRTKAVKKFKIGNENGRTRRLYWKKKK